MIPWFLPLTAAAQQVYQQPPAPIAAILDAKRPPATRLSPDRQWIVELDRPELPSIAELAAPKLDLATLAIDPATHGPARESTFRGAVLRPLGAHDRVRRTPLDFGPDPRIRDIDWSDEGDRFAVTRTTPTGIELWVVDVADPKPRRLLGPILNATYGEPCRWLPGDAGLVCKVVPSELGERPAASTVPTGPRVEENRGRAAPGRTWQHLLQTDDDEAQLAHFLTSRVVHVTLDGKARTVVESAWIDRAAPSPDGRYLLVETVLGPMSRQIPVERFARAFDVVPLDRGASVRVAELAVADAVPAAYGSVRTGLRAWGWRADRPATLWTVEALDGGDNSAEAPVRDVLSQLAAPFIGAPAALWRTDLRFSGVQWGDDQLALVSDWWFKTRRARTFALDPSHPENAPKLVWDRSYQDRYGDPGEPMTSPGPYGAHVLRKTSDGRLLLSGQGYGPTGIHPFLDLFDLTTGATERRWQAADPWYETLIDVLDDRATRLITSRQSADEPANLFLRRVGRANVDTQLTGAVDWAPAFAKVTKQIVAYRRADGLELSATLYLPPGYDAKRDGPLPTVFWAYPDEFKRRDDAAQNSTTTAWFTRPGGTSHLFFLLQGYAVVDDPRIPIVGEGEAEPNDTFVDQLVSGASAAVDHFVAMGVTDPDRIVVGGHSYGAFMTANLLAHSDLFCAGIARSGAYNRTLTPFTFQGEERTFWEAPDTYISLSPFTVAPQINEPLLLLHGGDDSNPGTWPMQSQRMFEALKGVGGTVRWVELPLEDHGYRARESVGHTLWEMITWADACDAPATEAPAGP